MSVEQIATLRAQLQALQLPLDARSIAGLPVMEHAFFPGKNGLWAGPKATQLPSGGVLILGSNFGCDQDFLDPEGQLRRQDEMHGTNPTWTGMRARLAVADIPVEQCFFSNAWPCLHRSGSNLKAPFDAWLREERSIESLLGFFNQTLGALEPKFVVALGPKVAAFLARRWPKALGPWHAGKVAGWHTAPWARIPDGNRC